MNFVKNENSLFGNLRGFEDSNGVVWFAAEDVLAILKITHGRNALSRIETSEKSTATIGPNGHKKSIITEAALYQLVFTSRTPMAKEFCRWVTHEVLPNVRKNGGYVFGQETLPASERKVLESKIQDLAAEVEKVKAGNVKLSRLLANEEDRTFDLREKLHAKEKELENVRKDFGNIEHVRRYLDALTNVAEMDAKHSEARAQVKELEARIPYAKAAKAESDPLVTDRYGNVCRRSEALAKDYR